MDGVFFAVLLFLVHPAGGVSTNEPRNGACRDNREEFGFALIGHDYKSFHADNFGRCFFKCSIDEICQSATFLWNSKECKMKNETKRSRPADFVENPASTYMENSFRGMWVLYNEEPYRASFNQESDKKNPKTLLRTGDVVKTLYKLIPLFWTAL